MYTLRRIICRICTKVILDIVICTSKRYACSPHSGNFGTVFVDQSYWQSSVAAKPKQGVWGFLTGGITWFAVPFTFATTMGMAYIALGAEQGAPLLSDSDVNKGELRREI